MAISYVGSSALAASATASVTPAHPAGLATGDILLALIYSRGGNSPTPPSGQGWTQVRVGTNTGQLSVWRRVFTSGDTAGAWTTGGTLGFYGVISAFRGVDTTTPLDVTVPTATTGTTVTATAPTLTTVSDNAVAVSFFANADNGGGTGFATPTNGFTLTFGGNTYTTTVGSDGAVASTRKAIATAGSVGTNALTVDDDFGFGVVAWVGITLALRPASISQQISGITGIPSAQAFGSPSVVPGTANVSPTGISSGEAFGAVATVAGGVLIVPAGVPSAETFGTASVVATITPTGIPSDEAFGTATLNVGPVLAPTGIESGETFGELTVDPGPISFSPAGIASAEAFGDVAVVPRIVPTGIPSDEAFGTPTLTVGPVVLTPQGVPSGEAFGAPEVDVATVAVSPAGIPSAEAFGTPQVDLELVLTGIPSAEAFGSPTLTVGLVVVTPSGIPSAETFGSVELTVTLDPTAVVTAQPDARPTVSYELLCMARIPQVSGPPAFLEVDPIEWTTLTWSSTLSQPQGLTAVCPIESLPETVAQRLRNPARLPTELWLLRNGEKVFAGPLMGGQRSGNEVTLVAAGLLSYLAYMFVTTNLRYSQVDQFSIAAGLVDHWQNLDYGNFGIDTSTVGLSGQLRDIEYPRSEIHQVSRKVEELGVGANGFDAEVDPVTRKLQLWYPGKGVDRSTGADSVVFDDRVITSPEVLFSIAPGDLASDALGAGTATGSDISLWSEQFNFELRATFGRAGVGNSWSDTPTQGALDDKNAGALNARDQALFVPGPKMRVTPDADLNTYAEGDIVSINMDSALGLVGAFRIRKRTVNVAETGIEDVDLEFV